MESERDVYRQFQDWCLRTYGDSGKTKTVTRKKYERIVQLLNGCESSSTDNAKFKFWVKSKGFQLGQPDEVRGGGGGGAKQVLYVPVKTTQQRLSRARSPPRLRSFHPRVGRHLASSDWAIVPRPSLCARRVSRLRHRA
ncbi:hypothetical protein K5549_007321 [Capra hircus]|nr:hypothetical protein K5549_007321 [Capra hircus]